MSDLDDLAAAVRDKGSSKRYANLERIWTIHDQGRQFGPHTEHEVGMLLGSGAITRDALVWKEGSPRWIPVTNIVPISAMSRSSDHPQATQATTSSGQVVVNIHNTNASSPVHFVMPQGNGLGAASLVLGIIAIVLVCVPFISIPLSTIGLVLGIVGLIAGNSSGKPIGTSIAGTVLCGIVTLLAILIVVGFLGSLGAAASHSSP